MVSLSPAAGPKALSEGVIGDRRVSATIKTPDGIVYSIYSVLGLSLLLL